MVVLGDGAIHGLLNEPALFLTRCLGDSSKTSSSALSAPLAKRVVREIGQEKEGSALDMGHFSPAQRFKLTLLTSPQLTMALPFYLVRLLIVV